MSILEQLYTGKQNTVEHDYTDPGKEAHDGIIEYEIIAWCLTLS